MTLTTRDATIETADGPMRLYEAVPDAPRGAVVVVMEAFGVTTHIEDVARRAASAGWYAVAPDLFHRAGGGAVAYDDFAAVLPRFAGLDDAAVLVDLDATLAHLDAAGHPAARTGIVGFCWGGRVAFLAAARRTLGAAVTFYGGGIVRPSRIAPTALVDEAASLQTPWLGLFGDLDQGIPVDDVEALRTAVDAATVDHAVVRYADADHGFHCDDRPAVFHPVAAADAWARTLTWFDDHLR